MSDLSVRTNLKRDAINRQIRSVDFPEKNLAKVSEYYGDNVFDPMISDSITVEVKKVLKEVSLGTKHLEKEHAEIVAKAVTEWAISRGATHFCHWFQPLTGASAEKHDAFLSFKNGLPVDKFNASQLMQGEPDASSFPNGGTRSTFEARGYTSWDMTSPLFLVEGVNGKTLCVPTAFVSYHGDALDIKTPLLRSVESINTHATKFLNLIGEKSTSVMATCGAEQEYFLVDKSFYFSRPDLVMTGRTLFGKSSAKHQQLDDHYFGAIPERVKSFMDELNFELHRLGIPAKTQHNEVAPGQYEIAPIFEDVNISADHNQLMMAVIKNVANRHDLVALLHEKPFAGINGSGKHVNWSLSDNLGTNLLEPGKEPHANHRFLAIVAIICEAVKRSAPSLRMAISGHGNDHRLGANEAPPSIISVYLGDTIQKIFESIMNNQTFTPDIDNSLDMGANQLAGLLKDNSDRNRTSPFAFTGNKFEFRAVGSSQAIGFPLTILNGAVASVLKESNKILEKEISGGKGIEESLFALSKKWILSSKQTVFNGDNYSDDWVQEAKSRGLPNLRTTSDALDVLGNKKEVSFLEDMGIYSSIELEMRQNVLVERYNTCREIEFETLLGLVFEHVIPSAINYKEVLSTLILNEREIGMEPLVETEILGDISDALANLYSRAKSLKQEIEGLNHDEPVEVSKIIANDLMGISEEIAEYCNSIEGLVPDNLWTLPKYFDLLYIK
ncbi:MAG: glutamine synthetase type III [Bdellovibrionales bacterium]|jgi:glutamine synthetase|nr:glutamine synthetase type III [Bdellovibrionales bacterium]